MSLINDAHIEFYKGSRLMSYQMDKHMPDFSDASFNLIHPSKSTWAKNEVAL